MGDSEEETTKLPETEFSSEVKKSNVITQFRKKDTGAYDDDCEFAHGIDEQNIRREYQLASNIVGELTRKRPNLTNAANCFKLQKTGTSECGDFKFAQAVDEQRDKGKLSTAIQRKLLRDQCSKKSNDCATASNEEIDVQPFKTKLGSLINRYYTQMYAVRDQGDQFVNMHSNRLCVIGIAPSHDIVRKALRIKSIDFRVGPKGTSLLEYQVRGKKKKGGLWLQPDSLICKVKCESGEEFKLYSCIRASLLEVNTRLIDYPELLVSHPGTEGYVVIARPKLHEISEIQASLTSKADYSMRQ